MVHDVHPFQAVPAPYELSRVTSEGDGVAGHGGDSRDAGSGQRLGLGGGAGPGRVDHGCTICAKLVGTQRVAKEVARFGRHPLETRRVPPAPVERREEGCLAFHCMHLGAPSERKGEGPAARKEIDDARRIADRISHRGEERRFPLPRRLKEGAGRQRDLGRAAPDPRRPAFGHCLAVPCQPGEVLFPRDVRR